jgi:hypothetical protein
VADFEHPGRQAVIGCRRTSSVRAVVAVMASKMIASNNQNCIGFAF